MIRDYKSFQNFEEKYIANSRLSYTRALAIFEDMWRECREISPSCFDDPLEGIEVDIKLARILNTCSKNSTFPKGDFVTRFNNILSGK